MNRVVFISFFLIISGFHASAQQITLQQAIDSALSRNIRVRQSQLLVDAAQVNWNQARANLLPSLNANVNHGLNQGRSIDPFTNAYVNQSVNYASYGLRSDVDVFNGMTLQNRIKQTGATYQASKMELQQAKDNLVLNIILAYLAVLNNEDQLQAATDQASLSQKQLDRLLILDKQGAIKPSEVSDVRGQLMNDMLSISNLRSQLEVSKLELSQLMNIPYSSSLQLQRIPVDAMMEQYKAGSSEIFQTALQQFPLVKSAELRKQAAEYALRAARGELYPRIGVGGSMQTNYSSVAQNSSGKISYNEQLKNNIFYSLGVGISIPIFNGKQVRNRIKLADIDLRNTELLEEDTRLQLRQQVEQAWLNMNNSYNRYTLLLDQVKAFEESFKAAEARFTAGVGSTVDYLIAKTNLDRARINLISAQYDYILRTRILDYYSGRK